MKWLALAARKFLLALVGTKGVDKAAKLAKGSKVAQTARRRLTGRLPVPVQKFFSKDTWRNMVDYYLRGKKINWKNTLITGATGISLLGVGAFGVPKVVKFIKKIDIDCSFASHQSADRYLATMLMPKLDCDFSYDKDGGSKNNKLDSVGEQNAIHYHPTVDKHGWISPSSQVTKDLLAKQTKGLSSFAERERQRLADRLIKEIGSENDDITIQKLLEKGYSKRKAVNITKFRNGILNGVKNIATAKVEIEGLNLPILKAYSGKNVQGFDKDWIKQPDQFTFDYVKAKEGKEVVYSPNYKPTAEEDIGHGRQFDTESKILEFISKRLGKNPGKNGDRVTLFTERKTCPGCQGRNRTLIKADKTSDVYYGVIDQFSNRHPNIEVTVYDGEGRKLVLKGGKVITKP